MNDEDELYKDEKVKNIIVNTPHYLHAESILKSIKFQKNIFIEKPAAINIVEVNKIIEAIKLSKKLPIIRLNYNRRYSPYIQEIKKIILNQNSSKTIQINVNTKDYSEATGWLSDKKKWWNYHW